MLPSAKRSIPAPSHIVWFLDDRCPPRYLRVGFRVLWYCFFHSRLPPSHLPSQNQRKILHCAALAGAKIGVFRLCLWNCDCKQAVCHNPLLFWFRISTHCLSEGSSQETHEAYCRIPWNTFAYYSGGPGR